MYAATTKNEGNAADGRFSVTPREVKNEVLRDRI
jgi:hypothetical protein